MLTPYTATAGKIKHSRTRAMGIGCRVFAVASNDSGCFVTFVTAKEHGQRHLAFSRLLQLSPVSPRLAMAGTFFSKTDWEPVGEIIVDGKEVHFGGIGDALCVFPNRSTAIRHAERNRHLKAGGLRNALRSGPRVLEGRVLRTDYSEQ